MEIIDHIEGSYTVLKLSDPDVVALNNALLESLEHLEDWEFHTRMGVSKEHVRALLEIFSQIRVS